MDRKQVVPGDFHAGHVIHHFQISVNFSFNLSSVASSKTFSRKIVLYPIRIALKIFVPPQNNEEKFHTPAKNPLPRYPGLKMTAPLTANKQCPSLLRRLYLHSWHSLTAGASYAISSSPFPGSSNCCKPMTLKMKGKIDV